MRITTFIILAACLHVSAGGFAQKLTIHGENLSLKQVFAEIKKQAGYVFMVNDNLLVKAQPVTIYASEATVAEVLAQCMKGQPLTFEIVDKTVFIKEKLLELNTSLKLAQETADNEIPVKGRVTDENGQPVNGVTVTEKGTKKATATDANGEFSLSLINTNGWLVFSGANIETQLVSIDGKRIFTIQLKLKVSGLDEVQVIAYGTTTKRLNTGSVITVKAEDIEKQPINNPLLALEGRVPGLLITQNDGFAGGGVTVRIQGANSINNGNDPLYVVDGVPYISQSPITTLSGVGASPLTGSGGAAGSGTGSPLSYINPTDIESIEILKDADATAIYGSRAANGAILITTKKGKIGQSKINVNMLTGEGKITRQLKLMNNLQYLEMRHEALTNDGISDPSPTDYDINGLWDTTKNTDWQNKLIGGIARYTNINTTISGGNSTTEYLISGTYHKESTVFPGNFNDEKNALHFNLGSSSPNNKFHIQLSTNYLVDNNHLPQFDLTGSAITLPPDAPAPYTSTGALNWMPDANANTTFNNPIAETYQTYQNKTINLIGNAVLSYKLLDGIDLKSNFGYSNLQGNEFSATPLISQKPEDQLALGSSGRYAFYSTNTSNSWIVEPQITFKKQITKSKIDLLLGSTIQQNNNTGNVLIGTTYNSDAALADIHSAANVTVYTSTISTYKYSAIFSRLNYNFEDKYIINLVARRDGSSRFGANNQFKTFGSIAGCWIFSQESFFKNNFPSLSFGKLRGSYGLTGNDQIGDYKFLNLYAPVSASVPYQGITGLRTTGLPNPYLQWEETRKLQIGLDIGLLKDKIILNANYARNRSSNQLLGYQLPIITGFNNITENLPAIVQNTSWELSLLFTPISTNSFSWNININLTIPKNKLISYPILSTSNFIVGQPIGTQKVLHFKGVNPSTGIYVFSDSHGNETSSPNTFTDNTILINDVFPKYYGGIENSFKYKNISLQLLFQIVKQIGPNYFFGTDPGYQLTNEPTSVLSRWQKSGDITSIQRYNSTDDLYNQLNYAKISDAGYSDASFIRLKNLSLSYQVPLNVKQRLTFQNLRIFIQGQNLLTITKYKGMDPENNGSNQSLPPLKMITLGANIGF